MDPISFPKDHPFFCGAAFVTTWPEPLADIRPPWSLLDQLTAPSPVAASDEIRDLVRKMLRHSGFKPAGRNKPASEYLLRAHGEGKLSAINAAVDVCNIVSYHSGLPISVIDADLGASPFRIDVAGADQSFVFNASGQVLDLEGLLCVFDQVGPCANAIKDSQRTKTHAGTRKTLSVIWGHTGCRSHVERTAAWYAQLQIGCGATVAGP